MINNIYILYMSYFKIDLSPINAGLSHQTSNFKVLIKYCFLNNLNLIKPKFKLIGSHNNNKELNSDLSKYYDLNNITVNDKPFRLYDDNDNIEYTMKKKTYGTQLLRQCHPFKTKEHCDIKIPYNEDIINTAKRIALSFKEDYMCIHVRRGDRITNKTMDIDTQPDNIIRVINNHNPKSVYIMTNKFKELKSLSNIENIFFYKDFEFLQIIDDNYYLFSIENQIMEFAKIRCSTFNVKKKIPNDKYYHCYLTDYPGLQ